MFGHGELKVRAIGIFWWYSTERVTVLQNAFEFSSVSLTLKQLDEYIYIYIDF